MPAVSEKPCADNRHRNLLICTQEYNTWLLGEYARRFARGHFHA